MPRSRANEIPELIRHLGSRSQTRVDDALARLSVIGARAVEPLIAALEGDHPRIRSRVMPLLAMIKDPRGREPLVATLLDRSPRMREIAAASLTGFPSPDAVAALERTALGDRYKAVRVAAMQGLVAQYVAGQEQAIRLVLAALVDEEELPQIRLASFALLPALDRPQRRSILARLLTDPAPEVRRRAEEFEFVAETKPTETTILTLLADLTGDDYGVWTHAVRRLAACGSPIIEPLVSEMRSRSHDPKFCNRAGMALKALGPRRGRSLVRNLETVEEPLPLQVLVEVIGALGERSMIYRLKELLDRIAARAGAEGEGFDPMQRVRAKAQLELARLGSRVAIRDLREALTDGRRRIEPEMISAIKLVGKPEEIEFLVRLLGSDPFLDGRVVEAILTIMKRERIRRNSRALQSLSESERRALHAILPRRKRRGPKRATRRLKKPASIGSEG